MWAENGGQHIQQVPHDMCLHHRSAISQHFTSQFTFCTRHGGGISPCSQQLKLVLCLTHSTDVLVSDLPTCIHKPQVSVHKETDTTAFYHFPNCSPILGKKTKNYCNKCFSLFLLKPTEEMWLNPQPRSWPQEYWVS